MKKNFLKKVIITSSLIWGLGGAVNVAADSVDNPNLARSVQYGPTIQAVKSYWYEKYAHSSDQLNKRSYSYVYVTPNTRERYHTDTQTTWYVSRANTFKRVYYYTNGY